MYCLIAVELFIYNGDISFQALESGISKLAQFGSFLHTVEQFVLFYFFKGPQVSHSFCLEFDADNLIRNQFIFL